MSEQKHHVEDHACDPCAQEVRLRLQAAHVRLRFQRESTGLQAAEALGVEPNRVLKTLMAEVDGTPVCAIVPADCEVSMKKLAAAFDGKSANMMRPADAERMTGYHVGGISPFGQKKRVPVAIERAALGHLTVFVNGGQRGLQIEIDPNDASSRRRRRHA